MRFVVPIFDVLDRCKRRVAARPMRSSAAGSARPRAHFDDHFELDSHISMLMSVANRQFILQSLNSDSLMRTSRFEGWVRQREHQPT